MSEKSFIVFIGGFPSGGTDLLKSILNAHPKIHINGEMPFLYNLSNYLVPKNYLIKSKEDFLKLKSKCREFDIYNNLENLENLQYESFGDKPFGLSVFFKEAFSAQESILWGNKTPQNTENIPKLKEYFPSAKFVVIVRDVRDIVLSWEKKWGKDMFLTAEKWNMRMLQIPHSDPNLLVVRYEDLLTNLKLTTQDICAFLGIEWSEDLLSHHTKVDQIVDGKINYGEKLVSNNLEKWRTQMLPSKIERVEEIAFTGLKQHKYELVFATSQRSINPLEKAVGFLQDIYATIFVGNRFKSNNSFGERLREIKKQIKIKTR